MYCFSYTCIPTVGATGSSGSCPPPPGSFREWGLQARRGVGGHRLIGELGSLIRGLGQAHQGAGPAGSAGSRACSQTSRAHRHANKTQYIGPARPRGAPMGESGPQAHRGVGGCRPVGDLGAAGSSGFGPAGPSGRMACQLDGLPDLGARRECWNCNVARNSGLGVSGTGAQTMMEVKVAQEHYILASKF